jgi:spore germination protein YaaH
LNRALVRLVAGTVLAGALLIAPMLPGSPVGVLHNVRAASRPDTTHPDIMSIAAASAEAPATGAPATPFGKTAPLTTSASISNPHLQREVFGFVNAANLGNTYVGYPSWDLSLLSTVAYFGIDVNSGGGLITSNTGWAVFTSGTMSAFINAAHANGVRVVLSIDLHDFSTSPNSIVCQGLQPTSQQTTIPQIVQEMQRAGVDGVNVDYEGTLATCANGATNRDELVQFVAALRSAMTTAQPGSYLAIDTFSGAAEDDQEFFNIAGLGPYVDSFFVMAYDMDEANYFEAPLNCTSYCFNPVSPLNTYRFNVTKSMQQYTALVPSSKVILGQPYYGRRGCVASLSGGNEKLLSYFATPTYIYASTIQSQSGVYNFHAGRDPGDGVSEWNTWYDTDWSCNREQYFDDVYSLGAKYNVVLQDNLRGVGLFTLDYGGGSPELWSLLNTYFSCTVTVTVASTQTTTQFDLGLSAGTCSVSRFDVQQWDATLQKGWFNVPGVGASGGAGTAVVQGYPGYTYMFRVRAHSTAGITGAWSGIVWTQVSSTATLSHPFRGLYTLDAFGGVNADLSPPLAGSAYWPNWKIARAAHALPGAGAPQSGLVLDGLGGLHAYGVSMTVSGAPYWGWDIARDFAFLPDGSGGYVLDGYGGLHPFGVNGHAAPAAAHGSPYWGWDIARKVVLFSDGSGGYVMDGYGGLHPFGIGSGSVPAGAVGAAYWPGWQIARDVVLIPGSHAGYTLDGYGGLHPFNGAPAESAAYWGGFDIARGVWLLPGSTLGAPQGYTLDGYGGLHPFGGAPALTGTPYWPGWDIAKSIWGA